MLAVSAAAAAQAQPRTFPNWKPRLGVLGQFSYANLELVKAGGFTRELGLDPRRLDDAAIESIRQRVRNAGIFVSSLDLGGNHIDPDPTKRETQNQYAMKMTELAGKLGVAYTGGLPGTIKGARLAQ